MKTVTHPIEPIALTFDPTGHTYTDNLNRPYISVTSFVKSFFPPFDEQAAAARIAARTGRLEMEIITDWNQKRTVSAAFGTAVHAHAEARIRNQQPVAASSALEQRAFGIVDNAISMLSDSYELLSAEQIIFDPLFQIAGTLDLFAMSRSTGLISIIDWKTCETINNDSYGQARPPIAAVRDSKLNHYALQLSLYAMILTDSEYSGYPSRGEPVELALIHIAPDRPEPVWIQLPNLRQECTAMLEHRDLTLKNELAQIA